MTPRRAAGGPGAAAAAPTRAAALLVMLIAALAMPAPSPGQSADHVPQFRAYWADSFGPGLYTAAQIEQLVADARAANFNAIIAQVTRRGDCLCNRSAMPRTEAEIDPPPFDPLEFLVDRAHAAGIEVHAWINAGIMWGLDTPPRDPAHVFHAHGPGAPEAERWVMPRYDGAIRGGNLYFFDPGHPGAAEYIVTMALSLIRHYDLDGLNLDYIRYPDFNLAGTLPSWGYSPVALGRFRALTGRADVPPPGDPEWMAWRREQITGIVRRIYIEAYALKPLVRISADTITYGGLPPGTAEEETARWTQSRPYREVLQDWRGWMEEGILDLNIPMNYRRRSPGAPGQPEPFDVWNTFIRSHQYRRQAAIGTGLYLNTVDDSVVQIRRALAPDATGRRAAGWVGYSYRTPDVFVNERRRLAEFARVDLTRALTEGGAGPAGIRGGEGTETGRRTGGRTEGTGAGVSGGPRGEAAGTAQASGPPLFRAPVPTPPMTWKLDPATGHLHGVVLRSGGTPADQVPVELSRADGTPVIVRRTNGSGWFGFVDLPPGTYRLSVAGPAGERTSAEAVVAAGRVAPVSLVLR